MSSDAPTDADKKQFCQAAIAALDDPANVSQFQKDIEGIGASAVEIDQAFDRVSRGFKAMVDNHGSDFPEVAGYKNEWDAYQVVGTRITPSTLQMLTPFSALGHEPLAIQRCCL